MHRLTHLTLATAVTLLSCGDPTGTDGPRQGVDLNGDGTSDGFQYDLDNDGKWDAIDTDGDGTWEAGDFDEDGNITVFDSLGRGYTEPTTSQLAGWSQDVDPDFNDTLDPGMSAPPNVMTQGAVDLTSRLPSILNQGRLGSCAAFANTIVGSLARSNAEGSSAVISSAFLYERMLAASRTNCSDGTYIHTGLETLMQEGAPLASEVPYSDTQCTSGSTPGANGHKAKIGGFNKLEPFNRARVKEALSDGTPIVFGCTLPPNFMEWAGPSAANVFRSNEGQAGGQHGGGHAMVIVGYDDTRGAYRVQNSWGTDWGDRGYLWWDYADLEGRTGLHALIPQLIKANVVVDPNATPSTVQLSATGAVQFDDGSGPKLAIRLRANTELRLTSVAVQTLQASATFDQVFIYGDVVLSLADVAASGMYDVEVGAELDGASVSKTVQITLAAPEVDPDGP